MKAKGFLVKNPLNVLEESARRMIQQAALAVLEDTGVVFQHAQALEILAEAGCRVDRARQRAWFPTGLVEKCLALVPSSFTLPGRLPGTDIRVGGPVCHTSSFSGKNCLDLDTGQMREATEEEVRTSWRVQDYLPNLHSPGYGYGSLVLAGELKAYGDSPWAYVYFYALNARNVSKPGSGRLGGVMGSHEYSRRIFRAAGLGSMGSPAASPPLTYYKNAVDICLDYARAGEPIKPVSGLTAGANAPATLAGCLTQNVAEVLAIIVLAQVVHPGVPIIAQDYSQTLDMRTGMVIQGGIERGLMGAAWCQIWRAWDVPRMTIASSDSKGMDYQCAMEKLMGAMLHIQAGSSMACFMGNVYDELIWSPVAAIIDDEMAGMLGRVFEGVRVTEETLAVDVINKVGPIPGQFLDKAHTRNNWKAEQFLPTGLVDRRSPPQWLAAGGADIVKRARERLAEISSTHVVPACTPDQEAEIDEILEESFRRYFPDDAYPLAPRTGRKNNFA